MTIPSSQSASCALQFDKLFVGLDEKHFRVIARPIGSYIQWNTNSFLRSLAPAKPRTSSRKRAAPTITLDTFRAPLLASTVEKLDSWPNIQWDESAIVMRDYLRSCDQVEILNRDLIARYHAKLPLELPALEMRTENPLAPYQQVAATCAGRSEGFAFFMEQGTGKTAPTISAICKDIKRRNLQRVYRCLVVCPNQVRANWVHEFEKFGTIEARTPILRGDLLTRVKLVIDSVRRGAKAAIVVCSYDTLAATWEQLSHIEWDYTVLDESQSIANPRTARTKLCMELRDKSAKRLILTGTPMGNSHLDLYTQFEFCREFSSGFATRTEFNNYYGSYIQDGGGFMRLDGVAHKEELQERLSRMSFIIRKEEALPDLPSKVNDIEEVEMSPAQQKHYDEVADELMTQIETSMHSDSPKQLLINNVLTRLLRLAEITSGYIKWDAIATDDGVELAPARKEWFDPNPKINALIELLKPKGPNDKTLVWACFTQNILMITAALEKAGIKHVAFTGSTSFADRKIAEDSFNGDPECKVFVGNQKAGGSGLNLLGYPPGFPERATTNATHAIYYSQNWSSIQRSQSEDRAHRKGTRTQIRVTDLIMPGTIDEEIAKRVVSKRMNALEMSDLREILRGVLRG